MLAESLIEHDACQLIQQLFETQTWPIPFPNPISLSRENFCGHQASAWLVSPKLDGTRCVVVFGQDQTNGEFYAAFFDRTKCIKTIIVKPSAIHTSIFSGTVIDAELMTDKSLMVFDLYFFSGFKNENGLHERLDQLKHIESTLKIYIQELQLKVFTHASSEALSECKDALNSDGIIISKADAKWHLGRQMTYFKWKPKKFISIDVKVLQGGLSVFENGPMPDCFCPLMLPEDEECIIECLLHDKNGLCELKKLKKRTDKHHANSVYVAEQTWKNFQEDISIAEIAKYFVR